MVMLSGIHVRVNPYGLLLVLVACLVLGALWFGGDSRHALRFGRERGVSVSRLLTASIHLAQLGGAAIRRTHHAKQLRARRKHGQRDRELVTDADLRSHRLIVGGLRTTFPGLRVISEERESALGGGGDGDGASDNGSVPAPLAFGSLLDEQHDDLFVANDDVTVWVDPLDATQELTEDHELGCVSVMVCVAVRGHALVGVLHMPFANATYWGWRGYGQSRSVTQLQRGAAQRRARRRSAAAVLVSRSHAGVVRRTVAQALGAAAAEQVQALGGVGYKTLRLLDGTGDVYVHRGAIRKWDVCASDALLAATGGQLTDFTGARVQYATAQPDHLEQGLIATTAVDTHTEFVKRFHRRAA